MSFPAFDLMTAAFTPLGERNTSLDVFFYDVPSLTVDERAQLGVTPFQKGSIVVVSPGNVGAPIRHYKNPLRFINNEADRVQGIAIAGVGSSLLGTAALARNVANAYGFDVAGIVSGYGMADVLSEALGGWFYYGTIDRWRLEMQQVGEQLRDALPETPAAAAAVGFDKAVSAEMTDRVTLPSSLDTGVLLDILLSPPFSLKVLVGHSKGGLLIDLVLTHFVDELGRRDHPYYDKLRIVTMGAVVDLPKKFSHRRQFIGSIDWFGA